MAMRIATSTEDITKCYEVMRELRPKLSSAEDFVARVQQQQREGFQLAYLEHAGAVVTVAGFRVQHLLATGLTLYIDDLVTAESARSNGHGKSMLDALIAFAKEQGCDAFSLDSGTWRQEAHAFYFREGMRISSFHFQLLLK